MGSRKFLAKESAYAMAAAAVIYFLLDYPIRISGAYNFPTGIGIKSFLPFVFGLYLGPAGTIGAGIGAVFTSFVAKAPLIEWFSEVLCILIIGFGMWFLWFTMNRDGNVRLEKPKDYRNYILLVALLSAISGLAAASIEGLEQFFPTFIGYLVSGYLVSGLIVILLGGIFCLDPVMPSWCEKNSDVVFALTKDVGLDTVNEQIEETALLKGIGMKRVFEIENCLEEVYLRLRKELPDSDILGRMEIGTTISLRIFAKGKNYDPLAAGKEEDEMDLAGLKLIRHRALRASHTYRNGENRVHVVV